MPSLRRRLCRISDQALPLDNKMVLMNNQPLNALALSEFHGLCKRRRADEIELPRVVCPLDDLNSRLQTHDSPPLRNDRGII